VQRLGDGVDALWVLSREVVQQLDSEAERERTREQLLEAAARVFARRGYHGAAVDEVAEEAGYTTGALYSNFSGKEDLFLSLLERFAARQLQEIAEAAASGPSAGARARAGADTWMAFLEREPALVPLFVEFWSYAVRNPELRPRFAEQRARARDIVCGVIEQAARDLGLRFRVPPDQLATAVEALADGLALQRLADPESVPDDLFGAVLAALFDGATSQRSSRTGR
jgi:AcrR family transcriptional regulator